MLPRRIIVFFALCLVFPAHVLASENQSLREEMLQTYELLLDTPGDRSLNFKYAGLAMQMHDYESAIPPLERILAREENNAKLRLQLGILYNALNSHAIARDYFHAARATPGASREIINEAEAYLHGM